MGYEMTSEDWKRTARTADAALELAEAQIARVLWLHETDQQSTPFCTECGNAYPCRTVRIFRGEENGT